MSVSKPESFKEIIARQPRFHLVLLGSLGLALLGSSFLRVNKRGLLLHDTPSAFLVDQDSSPLPVRFARGFGDGALARNAVPGTAVRMGRTPDALPLAESVPEAATGGGGGTPATRLIEPRGSSALAMAPEAGSRRVGGLPGITNSGFMMSPAGPFLANSGSGGGNNGGGTDNGGGGTDNGGGGTDNGGGGTDNGGGGTDNGGGGTDNGGGGTDNGGGGTDNGGGGVDPGDGGVDPGTGGGDPTDTGGGDAPAVPEPAAWLMMIIGVGALGRMLRRQGDVQAEMVLAPVRKN